MQPTPVSPASAPPDGANLSPSSSPRRGLVAPRDAAAPHAELQYLGLLEELLHRGDPRKDRTGVGTRALFGRSMRFDLAAGFPALTTKKVLVRAAWAELLWMLSGSTKLRPLLAQKVRIWSDWPHKRYADETGDRISQEEFERRVLEDDAFEAKWGDLGPVYGKQWRRWETADGREIDQVQLVIDTLKTNPTSRRILWDGWNVGELDSMALPPCHKHYQFFVRDGRLDVALVQRSADAFLGLPFNLANLGLVAHLMALETGYEPGEIVWFGLDVHLYGNHVEAAETQLARTPRALPRLVVKRKAPTLFDYALEDLALEGYDPYPTIKAEVAV
jgi:thymidylate synthase